MQKIIHIDMDAFFAQVEIRDNPNYQGKPIIIGSGNPQYGVVSTCSYEARVYGVRSAMPNVKAHKLCPHAIFVRQNYQKYVQVSKQIFDILHEVTDIVETLSLDEAYLDVTVNKLNLTSATEIAKYLRKRIYEQTKLTASAGVSYNKLLAKLGSEYNKPNGLTVIPPQKADHFLTCNKLSSLPGVGKSVRSKLDMLGIYTIEDARQLSLEDCKKYFGAYGSNLYNYVRGIDMREVKAKRKQKSLGHETTLQTPLSNIFDSEQLLVKFTNSSLHKMEQKKIYARTFSVKIKYGDFTTYTRSISLKYPSHTPIDFTKHIHSLLLKFPHQNKEIRLIGVSFSNLCNQDEYHKYVPKVKYIQTKLF